MTGQRLKYIPYGQALVIDYDGGKLLRSYSTNVAFIDRNGYLAIKGKYSATTARHISAFIREYAAAAFEHPISVKSWEWLIEDKAAINVYTGEVSEWGKVPDVRF